MKRAVIVFSVAVLAVALAACSNSKSSKASSAAASAAAQAGTAASSAANTAKQAVASTGSMVKGKVAGAMAGAGAVANAAAGKAVFTANCSSCHQANGEGLKGQFPPLARNPVVTGDPSKVIHIVKFGLQGKISAEGNEYNGIMPAWSSTLSDAQIASVLTYVRSSFGNHAGAIAASQVTAVKK